MAYKGRSRMLLGTNGSTAAAVIPIGKVVVSSGQTVCAFEASRCAIFLLKARCLSTLRKLQLGTQVHPISYACSGTSSSQGLHRSGRTNVMLTLLYSLQHHRRRHRLRCKQYAVELKSCLNV